MWDDLQANFEAINFLRFAAESMPRTLCPARYFIVGYCMGSIPPEFYVGQGGVWPPVHISEQSGPDYYLADGSQLRFPTLRFPGKAAEISAHRA